MQPQAWEFHFVDIELKGKYIFQTHFENSFPWKLKSLNVHHYADQYSCFKDT